MLVGTMDNTRETNTHLNIKRMRTKIGISHVNICPGRGSNLGPKASQPGFNHLATRSKKISDNIANWQHLVLNKINGKSFADSLKGGIIITYEYVPLVGTLRMKKPGL